MSCRSTKQAADLKRELISQQTKFEITELSSPTALQRFGAPFRSDAGEVAPRDSELPLLRYIFVHHVRNFPFLDQAREKEFWQDKLQVVSLDYLCRRFTYADFYAPMCSSLSPSQTSIFLVLKTVWRRLSEGSLL